MVRDVVQRYHTKICKHVSHTKQLFMDVSYFFLLVGFVYVWKNNKIKKLLLELRHFCCSVERSEIYQR